MARIRSNGVATTKKSANVPVEYSCDVLTLEEAASYLRISAEDLLQMVCEHGLPARKIRNEWRFLKSSLQDWLRVPWAGARKERFWQQHFGALKDDPNLEMMVDEIYRQRGRGVTSES